METGIRDSGAIIGSGTPNPNGRTLQLIVAYDGTEFQGFQRLTVGRNVQSVLEAAWSEISGEPGRIVGAGRTDAGVHAIGQSISLRTHCPIPVERVPLAMNGRLPADVRIRRAMERGDCFHARFSAVQRTYRYLIRRTGRPCVFRDRFSLLLNGALNVTAMQAAADSLLGTHDFRSFGTPEPDRPAVRDLRALRTRERAGWLTVSLTANAFLRGMARTLVAQLLEVGRGESSPQDIRDRLHACDRGVAGKAAPPNGLYLARVDYLETV